MEFEINGNHFRSGKMNAFTQLHVSRRIAPILPKVLPAILKSSSLKTVIDGEGSEQDMAGLAEAFEPLAQALADISDDSCEYVFSHCLGVVTMRQGNSYTPIWNANNNTLMFDSIDLPVMVQIVGKVLWDNLGNFISGFGAKQATSPVVPQ